MQDSHEELDNVDVFLHRAQERKKNIVAVYVSEPGGVRESLTLPYPGHLTARHTYSTCSSTEELQPTSDPRVLECLFAQEGAVVTDRLTYSQLSSVSAFCGGSALCSRASNTRETEAVITVFFFFFLPFRSIQLRQQNLFKDCKEKREN